MSYDNNIISPISSIKTTDIIINQFQDFKISTSFFNHIFNNNISSYTINKCFINNTFCEDLIELYAQIISNHHALINNPDDDGDDGGDGYDDGGW